MRKQYYKEEKESINNRNEIDDKTWSYGKISKAQGPATVIARTQRTTKKGDNTTPKERDT
jgi:hypothetical protein